MPLPAIDLWMRFVPGTPLKQNKKTRFPETPRGKLIAELIPRLPRGVKGKMYTVYSAVSPGAAPKDRRAGKGGYIGEMDFRGKLILAPLPGSTDKTFRVLFPENRDH